MSSVTAALQVSQQIKDAGAYAGLASVLGLAVLSLLYFGQARELKRLREWAGRAPERTAELQEQAAAASAPPPAPARAAAAAAGSPAAGSVALPPPGRPGGLAPATSAGAAAAATGLPAVASVPAATPVTATAPPAVPAAAASATRTAGPAQANGAWAGADQQTQALAPVHSTAPGGPVMPERPEPAVPLRQVDGLTGLPRRQDSDEPASIAEPRGRSRGKLLAVALAVLGGLAAIAAVIVLLGKPSSDPTATTPAATTDVGGASVPAKKSTVSAATLTAAQRGKSKIFVLNGSLTNNLAAEAKNKLVTSGYRTAGGGTGNAANNTNPLTQVFYAPSQKRAAQDVAKQLTVARTRVLALTPAILQQVTRYDTQATGPGVVVLLGADKAQG